MWFGARMRITCNGHQNDTPNMGMSLNVSFQRTLFGLSLQNLFALCYGLHQVVFGFWKGNMVRSQVEGAAGVGETGPEVLM